MTVEFKHKNGKIEIDVYDWCEIFRMIGKYEGILVYLNTTSDSSLYSEISECEHLRNRLNKQVHKKKEEVEDDK